jgi:hypothetical protein
MNQEKHAIVEILLIFLFGSVRESTQQHPYRTRPEIIIYYPPPFSKIHQVEGDHGLTVVFEVFGLDVEALKCLMFIDDMPIPLKLTQSVQSIDVVELDSEGDHEIIISIYDDSVSKSIISASLPFSVEFQKSSNSESSRSAPNRVGAYPEPFHSAVSIEASLRSVGADKLPNLYFPFAFPRKHDSKGPKYSPELDDDRPEFHKDAVPFLDLLLSAEKYQSDSTILIAALEAALKGDLNAMYFHAFSNASNLCPASLDSFQECAEAGNALCHMAIGYRYWYGLHNTKESCGRALRHYRAAASAAMDLIHPIAAAIPECMTRVAEDSEVRPI